MADLRVMIVDDSDQVRQDLRIFLTLTGGIEIVGEARNGKEAVERVRALDPQVILMDLEMPVLDGYEATRQIKSLYPACRVIALTIHAEESERQMALHAGVDDFVVKGGCTEMLLHAIRNAVNLGQMPEGEKNE